MSCNACQKKFSFFTRENACPNCGFSYCSKCLKYKYNIPNIGIKKVCGPCYNKSKSIDKMNPESPVQDSTESDGLTESLAPVDITRKLESLENPAKPPIVMYENTSHWDKFKTGLEPADQEIVERLRKLKGEDKPSPSVDEIKRRLAVLKDENPSINTTNIQSVDTRTDQEKTDDLIQEYLRRLELKSANDPAKEIQERLQALKGEEANNSQHSKEEDDDDDDDEKATKKLIKKALAEAALEAKYDDVDELEEMEVEHATDRNADDKPSCVMCDQTVDLMRCKGCHGDLYCPVCFEDNHDDFEMSKHKTVRFNPADDSSPD